MSDVGGHKNIGTAERPLCMCERCEGVDPEHARPRCRVDGRVLVEGLTSLEDPGLCGECAVTLGASGRPQ